VSFIIVIFQKLDKFLLLIRKFWVPFNDGNGKYSVSLVSPGSYSSCKASAAVSLLTSPQININPEHFVSSDKEHWGAVEYRVVIMSIPWNEIDDQFFIIRFCL